MPPMLLLLATLAHAAQTVVIEVDRGPLDAAPMLSLRGGGEQLDQACRDDGQGRDRVRNDSIHTCVAQAPGYPLELLVRWGSGEARHQLAQKPSGDLTLRLGPDGFEPLDLSKLRQPPPQPQGADPLSRPGTTQTFWALLVGIVALGAAAFTLWPRRLPAGLSWDPPTREDTLPLTLPQAHARFSGQGPVLVVGQAPVDAPALHAKSTDVQDLLDTLRRIARAQPLQARTLLIPADATLSNPGDVGLSPRERLLRDAPPGTRVVFLTTPTA